MVLDLQQQISDEMEQERPSEERIAMLLCEIAGQLYKETNAKTQIAAQIARKRASLMKLQDAFNAAYFFRTDRRRLPSCGRRRRSAYKNRNRYLRK